MRVSSEAWHDVMSAAFEENTVASARALNSCALTARGLERSSRALSANPFERSSRAVELFSRALTARALSVRPGPPARFPLRALDLHTRLPPPKIVNTGALKPGTLGSGPP